jgi:Protein of unknown function (DUF2971)
VKLFRYYRAEHALSVLNDLEVRTSIPNTLNDPFELSPNIDPSQFTQQRCEAFLRQDHNVEMWYQREGRQRGFTNKKAFKHWYLKDISRRAAALLPKVPRNVERVRKNFANDFSEKWRLICGSCIPESILMWTHYAANHSGIVLEFDTEEPPFSKLGKYIFRVTYSEKKPNYVYSNKERDFQKQLFTVATTKAVAWEYEQEIRVIVVASRTALRLKQYLPVTAGSIKGVYLGCRASPDIRAGIRAALNRMHFRHVRLIQAELDPAEYALTFSHVG